MQSIRYIITCYTWQTGRLKAIPSFVADQIHRKISECSHIIDTTTKLYCKAYIKFKDPI